MTQIPPHGIQGFDNAEAAKANARKEFKATFDVEFAVMRRGDEYAWLLPIEYAERIAKANGVEIVERAFLRAA